MINEIRGRGGGASPSKPAGNFNGRHFYSGSGPVQAILPGDSKSAGGSPAADQATSVVAGQQVCLLKNTSASCHSSPSCTAACIAFGFRIPPVSSSSAPAPIAGGAIESFG